jgi:hypothetical protein
MTTSERYNNMVHRFKNESGGGTANRLAKYWLTQELLNEIDVSNEDPDIKKIVFILKLMNDQGKPMP